MTITSRYADIPEVMPATSSGSDRVPSLFAGTCGTQFRSEVPQTFVTPRLPDDHAGSGPDGRGVKIRYLFLCPSSSMRIDTGDSGGDFSSASARVSYLRSHPVRGPYLGELLGDTDRESSTSFDRQASAMNSVSSRRTTACVCSSCGIKLG